MPNSDIQKTIQKATSEGQSTRKGVITITILKVSFIPFSLNVNLETGEGLIPEGTKIQLVPNLRIDD